MLVAIVLDRFDEAHRGIAALEERQMIAAAQEAVGARDQLDRNAGHIALAGILEIAAKLVRRRIGFAA